MEFEWDHTNSEKNLRERDISFDLARFLFDGPVIQRPDIRRDYGEVRVEAIGTIRGQVVVCIYTDRPPARRIISMRYANRRERDGYREVYPERP